MSKFFRLLAPTVVAVSGTFFLSPALAAASTADDDSGESVEAQSPEGGFQFGSYGRTQFQLSADGNRGAAPNVVSQGPRLFQEDYAEFDLRYDFERDEGMNATVLFTFALFGPFAHYDGDFANQSMAVRNLYAEVDQIAAPIDDLSLWVGSRMYRGDDVYLLDFWPLDELNTVGGGAAYQLGDLNARVHAGVNRLDDRYQWQIIEVPADTVGTRSRVVLDRQRFLGSGRLEYNMAELFGDFGAKAVVYGEVHRLPEGERIPSEFLENNTPTLPEDQVIESIPGDSGFVLGTQLGLYESGAANHVNLFFRWARDLAAYGELGVPFGVGRDGTAQGAQRITAALSANWETHRFGVMAGGYVSQFTDAHTDVDSVHEFVEGAAVVRPAIFVTDHFHQAFEVSFQQRYPYGLDPATGRHHTPTVWQFSVLEVLSFGRGNYERPQLRLGYTLSLADEDAQQAFPIGDQRRPNSVEHIFSVGAEWWFNSSTY